MGQEKVDFQSVKVSFPEKAYLMTLWIDDPSGKIIIPLPEVFVSPNTAIEKAKNAYLEAEVEMSDMIDWAMITPLEFLEKFPLKKEYWDNPVYEYSEYERTKEFLKPFNDHTNYKLLVTPMFAKYNLHTAPMPFMLRSPHEDVELFMKVSDWYVDPTADSAAFYKFEDSIGVNLFTGETYHSDIQKNKKRRIN